MNLTKILKHQNDKDDNDGEEEIDKKEFERLTNDKNGMFKKWSNPINQSAIARLMSEGLDPNKKYTKKEITDLL